ncbi:MAG: PKD domain-containing protein [Thermoplasmatales archaeon]|nr:PKD domain-containing protein [Thermoplasmatales archaeon]MCK4996015.1 PKD domain-containing protein [Thermoplasmatales archaeon]
MKKKIFVSLVSIALLVGILSGCTEEETPTPTNTAPEASFTSAEPVGMAVNFTDTSTDADENDTLTWAWNFGDAVGTSIEQNPTYTYTSNGIFQVTLIVTDTEGETSTITGTVTIGTAPIAGITAPEGNITVNTSAQFTDSSTKGNENITIWSWDFGDDGTSDLQNPTHNYTAIGTYTVTLIVSDDYGLTDTITAEVNVIAAE